MDADMEEQEDELLALRSIFGSEEFVRDESKSAGEIRVCVDLPADFSVVLEEGETLRQYELSFLPPLLLTFELPEDYPSSSPPSFTLTCSWLTHAQLSALAAQLTDLYQATGGAVVLFAWVQFLKEDALSFLDVHALLVLPADEHSTQDSFNAALSEPKNDQHAPKSGPTDSQRCSVSNPREQDLSAAPLDVKHPIVILADGQDPPISDWSSTDPRGAVALDSDQDAQASDVREAEQTLQTSEFDQSSEEDFLNEGNVSASLLLPSRSSGPLDQSEQGAASLPIHPRESPQNEHQTFCGVSLTPSQILLSQLLIYDAAQKQKAFATTVFDCSVCFRGWLGSECVQLPECGHIFCQACLAEFCKLQITEGNVRGVTCPQAGCTAAPTPAQVKSLVGEELFSRYDRLLLQNTLDCMPDVVYCPRRPCGSAVILDKSSTAALCSVCGFAFCVTCRKTYHGTNDCEAKNALKIDTQQGRVGLPQSQEGLMALWDDYASGSKQRQLLLESRYDLRILQVTVEECLSQDWIALNSKNCPHCFCRIQKDRGCNMMTCSHCRQLFCWVCLARLTFHGGTHFQDSSCSHY